MKRPPDTETIIVEQAKEPEEAGAKSHGAPAAPAKTAEADVSGRKADKHQSPKNHREPPPAESDAQVPGPSAGPEAKSAGTPEAFNMSMNYLKNKTREGALYYHYDKTFFKKFFKSSHKKKT
jgi:hypothetical protein